LESLTIPEMVRAINQEDQTVAVAVSRVLPAVAEAISRTARAMERGGRLFYVGAGTSGRLGLLDAAECPPTFNVTADMVQGVLAGGLEAFQHAREGVEDSHAEAERDLKARRLCADDIVLGIAASGRTPYVLGALAFARQVGALTISLSCNPQPRAALYSDVTIAVDTGPEVLAGSTRLKAGTAQKMILNMISTGTMVRLGKTYHNLMVDMRATNRKLMVRARRVVSEAAGITEEEAETLLVAAGGEVKVAIVMGRLGIRRAEAEARISAAGGVLARTLGEAAGD
jgi:N-acetylmuramic acid 6-phosphate etherase